MTTIQVSNEMCKIPEADVELLKIMAHPVRLQIVKELEYRKVCNVTQLTELLEVPQSSIYLKCVGRSCVQKEGD
ncbi:Transcriptional repressor PagR [Bacillus sp. M21]|nr:Transcriptional repressor PagR [Bacillus sp. M21]